MFQKSSMYYIVIQKAKSGIYKLIGDRARSKPNQIFNEPFQLNAALATGRYAFPFVSSTSHTTIHAE